jgi:hypothetical protein
VEVVTIATPLPAIIPVPTPTVPSLKVMVPVGMPPFVLSTAVNANAAPNVAGFGFAVKAICAFAY